MDDGNKNKALTIAERHIIETGIRNGSTKAAIARIIGKDSSTVGKEIRLHRRLSGKCRLPLECSAYKKCTHGRQCSPQCPDFIPFRCPRRDRSPGACNGCSSRNSCRFDKYDYRADEAEHDYRTTLVDSRQGVNLTVQEAKEIAAVVGPLLAQGLSPYQIVTAHPELGFCEKTLYNYIEGQVFDVAGIKNIDLRRKTSRRIPKSRARGYKKREDRAYLKGRLYEDYKAYMRENPDAGVVQMDTVYNDGSSGPFLQTFKFVRLGLMVAFYHDTKTAKDMTDGVNRLEAILGRQLFDRHVEVLLTDRGSEFTDAGGIENRPDGTRRTRLFYCDPMQSCQKGSLEVHHEQLRYILPKGTDLRLLGLTGQDAMDLVVSQVDSAPVEHLGGRSAIEYTRFLYPELWEKLEAAGLKEIPQDRILLRPSLLKPFQTQKGECSNVPKNIQ